MSEEVKSDCSQPAPSHIPVLEETDQRKVLEVLPGGQRAAVFRNFVVVITMMALGATVLLGIGTLRQGFPLIVLIGPALECASCLDILVARKRVERPQIAAGTEKLHGVVHRLTRMRKTRHPKPDPDFQRGCASFGEHSETSMANRMDEVRRAKQWHRTVGNEMDEIVRPE